MTTLPKSQQRREELVIQVTNIRFDLKAMGLQADMIDREIAGLDFAIAEAEASVPAEQPKPPRLDIAAAILHELSRDGVDNLGVTELAELIERRPSQISANLTSLSRAGKVELVEKTSDRYRLPVIVEQKQEAAE